MTPLVIETAAKIIAASGRADPADAVLRRTVSGFKSKLDRQWLARAVFGFFRWRGWLEPDCLERQPAPDETQPNVSLDPGRLADKISEASALQERSNRQPQSFTDAALARQCVPACIAQAISPTPE